MVASLIAAIRGLGKSDRVTLKIALETPEFDLTMASSR